MGRFAIFEKKTRHQIIESRTFSQHLKTFTTIMTSFAPDALDCLQAAEAAPQSLSKPAMHRGLSSISETTLKRLASIERGFDDIEAAVSELEDTDLGACSMTELYAAKGQLAQLNGDLEKLQFTRLDTIDASACDSGQAIARSQRKGLNRGVETLKTRVEAQHSSVLRAISERDQSSPDSRECSEGAFEEASDQPVAAGEKIITLSSEEMVLVLCAIKKVTPDKSMRGRLKGLLISQDARMTAVVQEHLASSVHSRGTEDLLVDALRELLPSISPSESSPNSTPASSGKRRFGVLR